MDKKTELFLSRILELQLRVIDKVAKIAEEAMMSPAIRQTILGDLHDLVVQVKKAKDLVT